MAFSWFQHLSKDKAWLVRVTNAVNQHWQRNNATKKQLLTNGQVKANEHDNNG
jgi:hypothetical protein